MNYLLDVNMLVALGHTGHSLHKKALGWYAKSMKTAPCIYTCSITELGFVRVSVMCGLQPDVAAAMAALEAMKGSSSVEFKLLADDRGVKEMPAFVKSAQKLTDGHLLELAMWHSVKLVTLDKGIPGALLI
ncbi:MAG: hypothetical protein SH807_09125 [Blastochloris sp.]|nr:hypothetical protein [Blastochloris sp.]